MDTVEGKRAARAAIALLLGVVFLGWMMMWVVLPTNTYRQKWQPMIRARTTSTYFGAQGLSLLIFTFPVLFMAVLGSLYLHLAKDDEACYRKKSEAKGSRLDVWRRPLLVKGPLGVVSSIELVFLAMFIALLVWAFSVWLHISFSTINPMSAHMSGDKLWQAKLESAALRLGLVGAICFAFLFFPVTRGSSILPMIGLTSEGSIKYHIWLGHIVMTLFTAHGLCYIIYWAATNDMSQMLKWAKTDVSNVAGELALVAGLFMWVTSFPPMRRKIFEVFYYTHHLYFFFILFFILHVGMSVFGLVLPGVFLFLVDRYLRFLQSRQHVRLVSARLLPCDALELNFSKSPGLRYSPTSIAFINVPSISAIQWHPYTITSSSSLESDKLSIMIRVEGSWSRKLYQKLSSPSAQDRLDVSIEGPYGPASINFLRYNKLVMVSGGSGITPFISIIRELIFHSSIEKQPTPQIHLISVFKNSNDLTMLDLLLPLTGTPFDLSKLQFQIDAFITREKDSNNNNNNQKFIGTIWFKPNPSDVPISAILGPKSWLWLAAIISSSFVIFLILLGITTRYYIYPIDHNTNNTYSYASKSLLNMLFICVSIVVTASAATLWNKKQSSMGAKQVLNIEGMTPTSSPGSLFYNGDRELESLPHQSLTESSRVHFGARPDLKKLLFECKDSSVGVLVCGPTGLRHDVAAICSSGLASNLHFESISFSW